MTPTRRKQPDIARAAEILRSGGLVVFPTETVYGIGASAASDKGFESLRAFKGRPEHQPFTVHLPSAQAAAPYLTAASIRGAQLILHKAFPGPLTVIIEVAPSRLSEVLSETMGLAPEVAARLCHQNTVGLRCPDHPVAQELLAAAGAPVVASSANRRGQPPPHTAQQASGAVGDAAQMVIDGGPCRFAKPSTIVRLRQVDGRPDWVVERPGVYDERFVRKLLRWTIVMVCSGNTCRSPMAQGLAQKIIADQTGLPVDGLEPAGIRVVSAGVFASPGMPASHEAVQAMQKQGIDLSGHHSQFLTPELIHEADVIYCMTQAHRDAVVQTAPHAASKALLLDARGDIEDPIGQSDAEYQRCAGTIKDSLVERLKGLPL